MDESQRYENLRLVYQSQREESLQHRRSISNAHTLVMTGLVVILGVIVSAGIAPRLSLKILIGAVVFVVGVFTCGFMWEQRQESDKRFLILRKVEREFGFFVKGRYLPNDEVLPIRWLQPPWSFMGFTRGDWLQVVSLVILVAAVEIAVFFDWVAPWVVSLLQR